MSAQDSLGSSPRDRLLRSSRRFHPRITRRAKWIMAMGLLFSMTMIYFIILPALNKFHAENYEANPAELRTSDPESLRDKSSSRKMTFSNPSKGIVHFYWWNQDKAQDEWMASLDPDQTRTFHAIDGQIWKVKDESGEIITQIVVSKDHIQSSGDYIIQRENKDPL